MSYSDAKLQQIFQKARQFPNPQNPGWAQDDCGAWIQWSAYGNRDSNYGWEVDHIRPDSAGGPDDISNLRPYHWKNNAAKGAGRSNCAVTSSGDRNVDVP